MNLIHYKKALPYIRLLIGLSLIGLLLYKIPLKNTVNALQGTSVIFAILGFAIIGLAICLSAVKLQILAKLKKKNITLGTVTRAYYIGFLFNNFIPTDIGGDIFKINELRKNGLDVKDAGQAVLIERFMGAFALMLLAIFLSMPGIRMFSRLGIPWVRTYFLISTLVLCASLAVAYAIWLTFLKSYLKKREGHRLWGKLYRLLEGFYVYRDNLRILFQAFLLSLAYHLVSAVGLVSLTIAVGCPLPYTSLLMVIPIISFVSLLPISVGSLGIKEGALVFCLTRLGITSPAALAVALLLRICLYLHAAIGGLLYFTGKEDRR